MGMKDIVVVPKSGDKLGDIEAARRVFPRFYFDEEKCEKLHQALFNYKKAFDKKTGQFRNEPKHDDASHFADAMLSVAKMWREKMPMSEENNNEGDQSFFG